MDKKHSPFTAEGAFNIIRQATIATHGIDPLRIPSMYQSTDCGACNGTGYRLVPNGPDDVDKEPCSECNGTGRVVAN